MNLAAGASHRRRLTQFIRLNKTPLLGVGRFPPPKNELRG